MSRVRGADRAENADAVPSQRLAVAASRSTRALPIARLSNVLAIGQVEVLQVLALIFDRGEQCGDHSASHRSASVSVRPPSDERNRIGNQSDRGHRRERERKRQVAVPAIGRAQPMPLDGRHADADARRDCRVGGQRADIDGRPLDADLRLEPVGGAPERIGIERGGAKIRVWRCRSDR